MNELESRKRLLIAESEINRAELVDALVALKSNARAVGHRASVALTPIATSAAVLALGLTSCRRSPPAGGAKSSRLQALSRGATLLAALWLAFRTQVRPPR